MRNGRYQNRWELKDDGWIRNDWEERVNSFNRIERLKCNSGPLRHQQQTKFQCLANSQPVVAHHRYIKAR